MSKFLTEKQIRDAAKRHNLPYAAVKAVIEVESRGAGFNADGSPKILFERHIFWRLLGEIRWYTTRLRIMALHPRVCNPTPGGYGRYSEQHAKLQTAVSYNREVALQSCSWGLGQVMGFHWKSLGYKSLQEFVNAMFESEAGQLDAMLRFIVKNGLAKYMRQEDWAGFARRYNGPEYKKNRYDEKLAAAYRKYQ